MRRPLAAAVLAYLSGILLGDHLPAPLGVLLPASFGCFAACLSWERRRPQLLVPLLVLAGWTNLVTRTAVISPHDLRRLAGDEPQLVTVRGILQATPTERTATRDGKETRRTLAVIEVRGIRREEGWEPATGGVVASAPGELSGPFFQGQPVEAYGVLQPPPGRAAEGLFDYRAFLRRKGIHYQLRMDKAEDWRAGGSANPAARLPLADRFQSWARRTLAMGLPCEDEPLRLLWTMALGWKTAMTNDVAEPFMRSGTMHIFAISGLHIAVIAGILVSLLRVVQLPRGVCGLVAIPLLWFYTGATGWQASAIRSTIMMSIVIAGWSLERPSDLLNSLAGAALIILVWDPQQLFQASFQLSFVVVFSIGLLLPRFERVRQRLLQPDPFLPAELRPRWQRWLDGPVRFVTTSLATSLAAWLGSLPLVAGYFHLFTPVSLLANLLVVPLSAPALMSCLGSLLCAPWLPGATVLFNHSGWFWMNAMDGLSQWFASLPAAYCYVEAPSAFTAAIYYFALFGLLTGWLLKPGLRKWAFPGLGLVLLIGVWNWQQARQTLRITVLSARAGDALVINAPGNDADLLVDCSDPAGAQSLVKPFLRGQGIRRLAGLVLTHGDGLNVGGAETILQDFHVRTTVTSLVRFRSPVYRRVMTRLAHTPDQWRQVRNGDEVSGWQVLHPAPEDRFPLADENALVLRGEFHGTRVLLLSDLGRAGQRALLARGADLRADIVVAGIPTRDEPLTDELIDAVQPRAIILSVAEIPAAERPSPPLRARLARRGAPVFCTSQCGSVTLNIRPAKWSLATMTGERWAVP